MEKRIPPGKTIAVSDGAKREGYLLKRVLSACGRDGLAVIPQTVASGTGPSAAVLLAPDSSVPPDPKRFPVWVSRYFPQDKHNAAGLQSAVTYSTEWDDADFTARNIRVMEDGTVSFEIVGVGIIGRVRLKTHTADDVEPALAAAAAAIAAGVPFAEVLGALNRLDLTDPEAVQ